MIRTRHSRRGWIALSLGTILAWGGALSAPASAQQEFDLVRLADGKSETGKIVSEDLAGLTLELRGGASRTYPWASVANIEYSSAPELAVAEEAFAAGRFEEALPEYSAILESKARPPVMQQARLHVALIHDRLGQADEGLAAWRTLLAEFPKGRFLRRASEGLVWGLLARKQAAEAGVELDKIAAGATGLEAFAGQVELLRGRVFEAQEDWAGGHKAYQAAEDTPGASAAVKQEARLGHGRCLAGEGKKSEAEQIFRQLTREEAPAHVLAGAWNGMAALWSEEGKAKRDIDRLYEGLYGYLRGVVQYGPRAGEPTSEYECALAGAARCFRFISQLEQSPERKRRYDELASEHLAQLRSEFPHSICLEDT